MKLKLIAAVAACAISMTACGGAENTAPSGNAQAESQSEAQSESQSEAVEETTPDLTGTWKQVDGNSEETYQEATISGDTIEIYWVSDGGDAKSLYWAGTYEAPTEDGAYSWDSVNDHEKTDSALLASGDDTKTFTYEDGILSYSASAMGTTTTVKMEKAE